MSENRRLTEFAAKDEATASETEPHESESAVDGDDTATKEGATERGGDADGTDQPSQPGSSREEAVEEPVSEDGGDVAVTGEAAPEDGTEEDHAGGDGVEDGPPAGPRVTYSSDPNGGICADCGARSPHRWVQGDELVCPDCKDW